MERRTILLDRKARIEAQLAALEARARQRARKEHTRRAILAGEAALVVMDSDAGFATRLRAQLDLQLRRPADRALFGLADTTQPAPSAATVPEAAGDAASGPAAPQLRAPAQRQAPPRAAVPGGAP